MGGQSEKHVDKKMLESPRTGRKRLRSFADCRKGALSSVLCRDCEALEWTYVGSAACKLTVLFVFFDKALHRLGAVCLRIVRPDVQALRLKTG